jgi:hypothetical protein
MAFGQIDPARLEGDALTRWYLRSPADIEEEKRQRAEQAYNAFFGQSGDSPSTAQARDLTPPPFPADASGPVWSQVGDNRWLADNVAGDTGQSSDGSYQLAAASAPAGPGGWI